MTTLDFRKQKKNHLKITLNDEKATKLSILQPTKGLFQKMVSMSEGVSRMEDTDVDALDEVYAVCAELISRNKEGVSISKDALEDILDFEDIVIFLRAYNTFVAGIVHGKN